MFLKFWNVLIECAYECIDIYSPDILFYCRCGRCGTFYSSFDQFEVHYLTHEVDTDKRRKRAQAEATKALELRRKDPVLKLQPRDMYLPELGKHVYWAL